MNATANLSMTADETRAVYKDEMTLREARAAYFARTGFDDTTYVEAWVKLPVGPFHFYMPNFAARKEAVKVHDLNHIVGGYGTDWRGEFEISAFEIGMGTGRYWFGWFLDVGGLAAGLLKSPTTTLNAFARGRRAKSSVYHHVDKWDDRVLDGTVGALREALQLEDAPVATAAEKRAAYGWAAVGVTLHALLPLAFFVGVVAAVVLAMR